jgi:3-(3-hydroxy-phenyl)propionate hydroxylase
MMCAMPQPACDVVVAGFGPVGQLAARLLGLQGLSVVALERADAPFGLPRAAVTDDACLRILARAGVDAPLHVPPDVALVTAAGRALRILDPHRGAVPALASFDQVELEAALGAAAAEVADVRFGREVEAVEPGPDGVLVRCAGGGRVRARWLVACDGAGSTVRRALGIPFGGSTFAQRWLVVDAQVPRPVPGAGGVRFVGDPRRPAVTLPLAPGLHRWEFMLSGAEEVPDWRPLVARWTDPRELAVRRVAVYTYHARVAARWRAGRVLLAGDAAHVMPPFAGQGLSAGLRDADNLAWKLAAVEAGAPDALLGTYERERRGDVLASSALARLMGALLQTRRPRLARARDAAITAVSAAPVAGPWFSAGGLRPVPRIGRGAIARHGIAEVIGGLTSPGAPRPGSLAPAELEALLPAGWAVAGPRRSAAWERLGVPHVAWDLERTLVVRPDRYVFASGDEDALARAAQDYAARWAPPPSSPPATSRAPSSPRS